MILFDEIDRMYSLYFMVVFAVSTGGNGDSYTFAVNTTWQRVLMLTMGVIVIYLHSRYRGSDLYLDGTSIGTFTSPAIMLVHDRKDRSYHAPPCLAGIAPTFAGTAEGRHRKT